MEHMIKRMDHLGIAVNSIADAKLFYSEVLGMDVGEIIDIPKRGVRAAMIQLDNQVIELIEPLDEDSPVAKFLKKRGEGIHHMALEVKDIDSALMNLKQKGVQLITETPYEGAHGKRVAFLSPHSSHGVLIELCEVEK